MDVEVRLPLGRHCERLEQNFFPNKLRLVAAARKFGALTPLSLANSLQGNSSNKIGVSCGPNGRFTLLYIAPGGQEHHGAVARAAAERLLDWFRDRSDSIVALIGDPVRCPSPVLSTSDGLCFRGDAAARALTQMFQSTGWTLRAEPNHMVVAQIDGLAPEVDFTTLWKIELASGGKNCLIYGPSPVALEAERQHEDMHGTISTAEPASDPCRGKWI